MLEKYYITETLVREWALAWDFRKEKRKDQQEKPKPYQCQPLRNKDPNEVSALDI